MSEKTTHAFDASTPETAFAGWFEGKVHVLPVRIYYEDTDMSGIVYHANYLRYCERGRSDFLRLAGVRHQAMLEGPEKLVWALRRITLDYLRPARIDDLLQVRTRYTEMAGARLAGEQEIVKDGERLCAVHIEAAMITLDGRPRRIPAEVRAKMEPYLSP
jgi:acyl-CoA thioester hydrolase